ncbi:hypothetical protein [Sphingomonas sp. A2-49]|uniref:hypothetical protein n=1 Tax=Sphingomonas sp. A2-49 TaxID=1391375 RepID=UPI00292D2EFE|nr:hypothetical protein [Sphingomonas sp. A2-49]
MTNLCSGAAPAISGQERSDVALLLANCMDRLKMDASLGADEVLKHHPEASDGISAGLIVGTLHIGMKIFENLALKHASLRGQS